MGRQSTGKLTKTVLAQIEHHEYEKYFELCYERRITMSELIRLALRAYAHIVAPPPPPAPGNIRLFPDDDSPISTQIPTSDVVTSIEGKPSERLQDLFERLDEQNKPKP